MRFVSIWHILDFSGKNISADKILSDKVFDTEGLYMGYMAPQQENAL